MYIKPNHNKGVQALSLNTDAKSILREQSLAESMSMSEYVTILLYQRHIAPELNSVDIPKYILRKYNKGPKEYQQLSLTDKARQLLKEQAQANNMKISEYIVFILLSSKLKWEVIYVYTGQKYHIKDI